MYIELDSQNLLSQRELGNKKGLYCQLQIGREVIEFALVVDEIIHCWDFGDVFITRAKESVSKVLERENYPEPFLIILHVSLR